MHESTSDSSEREPDKDRDPELDEVRKDDDKDSVSSGLPEIEHAPHLDPEIAERAQGLP